MAGLQFPKSIQDSFNNFPSAAGDEVGWVDSKFYDATKSEADLSGKAATQSSKDYNKNHNIQFQQINVGDCPKCHENSQTPHVNPDGSVSKPIESTLKIGGEVDLGTDKTPVKGHVNASGEGSFETQLMDGQYCKKIGNHWVCYKYTGAMVPVSSKGKLVFGVDGTLGKEIARIGPTFELTRSWPQEAPKNQPPPGAP